MTDVGPEPTAPPTTPAAPPTARSGRTYKRRSRWPLVFGIVGIVLAAWGLLGSIGGIFSMEMMHGTPMPPPAVAWTSIAVSIALAAILLAGSIGLLSRRPWTAPTLWWWAIISVIYLVGSTVATVAFPDTFMPQLTQAGAGTGAQGPPPAMMRTFVYFGAIIGLLFGLAWPTIVLLWMSRRAVREEVRDWGSTLR